VNVMWAGSDDGLVQVTRDGGKTWTNVTPRDMPEFGRVSQIDASAFDAGSAYVSVKKPLLEDFSPYIFRTHDFGRTWTKIVDGIAPNDYVSSVREDPVRRGLLYAGAEHTFYVSLDDGDHWRKLAQGLPDTQVSDIWIDGSDVAVATHGRSFYILDDVTPLRQYNATVSSATDAFLFQPGDVVRAAGPARITYWLKKPPQTMKLEILDPKGQIVRSFEGAVPGAGRGRGRGDAAQQGDSRAPQTGDARSGQPSGRGGQASAGGAARGTEGEIPDEEEGGGRGAGPSTAPMAAGVQRFNWDVRYQPVVSFPGMVLWGATQNGPVALPGVYQARLTVDGRAQTQSFTVKKHPFHNVSDDDLQFQFDLASQIRDKVNEANNAIIQIRRIKQALADRMSKSTNADVKALAEELRKELTAVEEDVYQVRNQSNQDPLNFPIKTNNRLASLLRVALAGDGRPTGNVVPIFNDLKGELKAETDRLQRTLTTLLPRFNQAAQRAGLEQISEK
jgi:hypothetical protein